MAPWCAESAAAARQLGSGSSGDEDAMDEQTLVYWLNSLPIPSALLASTIQELDDGDIIIDVVEHLFPDAEDDGPLDLERALGALASGIGGLPPPFSDPRVAYANVLGGGRYALCWVAAVLRFAAGDGPPLGFKSSGDFKTFVDMGGQMDRVGSPRQEWGMANGSPSRAAVAPAPGDEDVEGDAGEEEPGAELQLPTALPSFDEVWRKSDGQWQPAAPGAPAHVGLDGVLARELLRDTGLAAPQPADVGAAVAAAAADDPTDEDAMRETLEQRFGAIKRRVDLSGRPAQHAHSWNASTYVEADEGVAAPAPPAGKQLQLLLADGKPAQAAAPEPEEPLYTRRGNLTERGLLVGTLCDPAPGSHIRTAKRRAANAAAPDNSKPRSPPRPASQQQQQRRARSQPRSKKTVATRRKQREHDLSDQHPFELDARCEKVLKWLRTMPLDLGPLAQSLRGVAVARRVTLAREILRKAFGAGRLLCQLVNVLEETHACTSTKSPRVNVNRALAMLRQRPSESMNIQHLWATDELLDADAEVTFELFNHIRQSYAGKGGGLGDMHRAARAASADKARSTAAAAAPRSDGGLSSTSSLLSEPPLDANGHAQATHGGLSNRWAPLLPVERRSLEVAQQHQNSTTDETVVRRRLRKLGFDVPTRARLVASNAGLLKDPLRNGTLLCALVERLDPRCKLRGVTREPDSLEAAVANVETAFSELRRLSSRNGDWFSEDMACDIVRGRQDLLWGLLARVTAPVGPTGGDEQVVSPVSPRRGGSSSADATTAAAAAGWCVGPYSVAQTRLLEVSLVQWVHSLGYLPLPTDVLWTADEALEAMLAGCCDGTLLCDLTSQVCSEQIPGITRRPRVAAAQLGNISKAFEVLQRRKAVSTKHLRDEEEIRTCVRGAILGLLEAMHRAYDKVPPPRKRQLSKDGELEPYLGKDGAKGLEAYANALEAGAKAPEPAGSDRSSRRSSTPTRNRSALSSRTVVANGTRRNLSIRLPPKSGTATRISLIPVPVSSPISSNVSSPRMSPREWDSPTRRRRRQQVALTGPLRAELSAAAQAEDVQPEPAPVACETEETDRIKRWLSAHGFNLRHPFGLPEPQKLSDINGPRRLTLEDFCDGTLLCDLVAKLQHRSKLSGVTRDGKSGAAFAHNIEKGLVMLREDARVPIQHLWANDAIQEGEPAVIVGLMGQLKSVYKYKAATKTAAPQAGASAGVAAGGLRGR